MKYVAYNLSFWCCFFPIFTQTSHLSDLKNTRPQCFRSAETIKVISDPLTLGTRVNHCSWSFYRQV